MFGQAAPKNQALGNDAATSSVLNDVVIHVMPPKLYGRVPDVAPKEEVKKEVVEIKEAPPSEAAEPVQVTAIHDNVSYKRSRLPLILGLMALIILGIGVSLTIYVFFLMPDEKPVVEEVPVIVDEKPVIIPPVEEPVVEVKPLVPEPGKDTDSDGLTDVEELLYGTDYRDPDTDKDTFLDGNEVFHRYHPNALAPATLLDTGAVRILQNTEVPFAIYHPSAWTPVITALKDTVTFRSPSTALFKITWQNKNNDLSLENWFDDTYEAASSRDLALIKTKIGYDQLVSIDGRVTYVDGGDRVYIFSYDLGSEKTIEYLQTFSMMVNSFTLLP